MPASEPLYSVVVHVPFPHRGAWRVKCATIEEAWDVMQREKAAVSNQVLHAHVEVWREYVDKLPDLLATWVYVARGDTASWKRLGGQRLHGPWRSNDEEP